MSAGDQDVVIILRAQGDGVHEALLLDRLGERFDAFVVQGASSIAVVADRDLVERHELVRPLGGWF